MKTTKGRNRDKCPKCKCKKVLRSGNMATHPDHWEEFTCLNCGFLVGMVDNSPYVSCYDFEDFIIEM